MKDTFLRENTEQHLYSIFYIDLSAHYNENFNLLTMFIIYLGPPIVTFFERRTNLLEVIDRFRKRRYVRLQSWPEPSAQSPERKV